jgi:hypothetical protein
MDMGFMFGGIIIKNGAELSNEEILQALDRERYYFYDDVSLEKATGGSFEGIAIARTGSAALIFGEDIAYSCSYEKDQSSAVDKKLEHLSNKGDILCFLLNGVSETYAWCVFSKGKKIRAKSVAEKKLLSGFGDPSTYEHGSEAIDDQAVIHLIENFTGHSFIELVFEKHLTAAAYR